MRFRSALKLMEFTCCIFVLNQRATPDISSRRGVVDYAPGHGTAAAIIAVGIKFVQSGKQHHQSKKENEYS